MNNSAFQTIMPVKPGTISDADKAALKEIGVLVIEHEDPDSIRLITPMNETDSGAMLRMAVKALENFPNGSNAQSMREHFGRLVMAHISEKASHE